MIVAPGRRIDRGVRFIQEDANERAAGDRVLDLVYANFRSAMLGEHRWMHLSSGGLESSNRYLVVGFEQVRRFHVLVSEIADGENVRHIVGPWSQDVCGIIGIGARMQSLPFRPKPIHLAVMSPEDRVARGRARRNHIPVLWLARDGGEVGIAAAGKVVHQVVDRLERAKEVVTAGT